MQKCLYGNVLDEDLSVFSKITMKDNRTEKVFIFLLKKGLWGGKEESFQFFPLSIEEWNWIYAQAKAQTVEGIIFDGFQFIEEIYLPPRALRLKWMRRIDRIERRNQDMNKGIIEQYRLFKRYGLHPLLLKGQGVASSYPQPLHRIAGDVDWSFADGHEFYAANMLLKSMGASIMIAKTNAVYTWRGVVVDHHNHIFDLFNPFSKNILRQLRREYPDVTLTIQDQEILVLHPLLQMIQISSHILKHSLAFGVGLRQYCDIATLYHKYSLDIDGNALRNIYKKLGILRWISVLHCILVDYIGLSEDRIPFSFGEQSDTAMIMDDIWKGGNFGFYDVAQSERMDGEFIRRKNSNWSVCRRLIKYFPYAPMEALCFPIAQLFSKQSHCIDQMNLVFK